MEHTPLPWRIEDVRTPGGDYYWQIMGSGKAVTSIHACREGDTTPEERAENDANAAFIICACNAHEDLVAALKWFFSMFDSGFLVRDITDDANPDYTLRMVKFTQELQTAMDAIAKAEGES